MILDSVYLHWLSQVFLPVLVMLSILPFLVILSIFAGSFKSQRIDYFRGHIVSWEKPLQFYAN